MTTSCAADPGSILTTWVGSAVHRCTASGTRDIACLSQIAAKALDAFAGVFEIGGLGGVRDAECRSKPERRALHHRDAFRLQKLGDEIFVIGEHLAGRR